MAIWPISKNEGEREFREWFWKEDIKVYFVHPGYNSGLKKKKLSAAAQHWMSKPTVVEFQAVQGIKLLLKLPQMDIQC